MALTTCPDCKAEISTAALACPRCGRPMREAPPAKPAASPGVAAVLSLVIPGAGQMYRGNVGAGLAWLLLVVVGYLLFVVPGLILHLICVVTAASSPTAQAGSAQAAAPESGARRAARTPARREPRTAARVVLFAVAAGVALILIAAGVDRYQQYRKVSRCLAPDSAALRAYAEHWCHSEDVESLSMTTEGGLTTVYMRLSERGGLDWDRDPASLFNRARPLVGRIADGERGGVSVLFSKADGPVIGSCTKPHSSPSASCETAR